MISYPALGKDFVAPADIQLSMLSTQHGTESVECLQEAPFSKDQIYFYSIKLSYIILYC